MWFLRFWELFCGSAGAGLIALALRNLFKGWSSRGWSRTQGIVVRSFVLVDETDGRESYTPQVEYEYSVGGKKYLGRRLRYGQIGSSSRKRAERVIVPYTSGTSTQVWFNPRDPSDAVLVSGSSWGNAAIAIAGLIFLWLAYMLKLHEK